jgi:hypothetical protein
MQKDTSSFQIHAWLAWSLFIGLWVALVMVIPVNWLYYGRSLTVADYLYYMRYEDVTGRGPSDWQWILFALISLVAMHRIARGEIKQDGRGWLVCVSGVLLFVVAVRLGDLPRVACLGLPLMMYGAARHIFGPVGKCMFIPFLILLLIVPLRQITWLETIFFDSVKAVILACGGTAVHGITHFLLCDDIYYGSVLRDTVTGLLLLFFLMPMRASKMFVIALVVLSWSYVVAVALYALEFSFVSTFRDMPMRTLARCAGWLLPLMMLVFDVFRRRSKKSVIP